MKGVSTIEDKMTQGSLDALAANPNGLIIGEGLAKKFGLSMGGMVNTVSPAGEPRTLKVVGVFRTGNANYDETQTFALLKRVQGSGLPIARSNRASRCAGSAGRSAGSTNRPLLVPPRIQTAGNRIRDMGGRSLRWGITHSLW